jgi:5-methylcytosine-specific restriction protein A
VPTRPLVHGAAERLKRRDEQRRRYDESRQADHAFYNTPAWRDLRKSHLAREPLCRECKAEGVLTLATVVDHIEDRRKRPELALSDGNLQSLCPTHHNARTGREHGFGARHAAALK